MRDGSQLHKIPELASVPDIKSFQDIIKVRDFVYKTVPWFNTPKVKLSYKTVVENYENFKAKTEGGWCGANAEYMQLILYWYEVKPRPYNFGIVGHNITHVGVIVPYDGMEFFIDPYLGVYYNHKDGFPLTFQDLMCLISDGKLDHIIPVYSKELKPAQTDSGWQMMAPEQLSESVIKTWVDYDKVMNDTFGSTNPLLLMQIKIPK